HHHAGAAQHDHAAVVDGVVEGRPRQHEPVHQGHGEADIEPVAERAQHAAGGGTVEEYLVARARVAGGDDVRLAVDGEADVADEAFVEDGVDFGFIVNAAFGKAADGGARGGRKRAHV